jgi:cytochrome c-type biogenesis protein CcsB
MDSSQLLTATTFIYALAALGYLAAWIFNISMVGRVSPWIALAGVAANTVGIILRWVESYQMGTGYGHAPLSNLYESLIFFAWIISVIYLIVEYRYKNKAIGAFAMPLAFFAMAYASLSPNISDRIQPLIPALKSNWLIAHVMACFIGYAAFAIAFGLGIMYLIKRLDTDARQGFLGRLPDLGILDDLIIQMVKFGFLFLTVGIITGAVWANSAWGRYWGWDPKETWSLVTWLIYATMLHFRVFLSWEGKVFAYFAILGFMAVLFTYFGVNYLPGLHSYGVAG